MSASSTPSRRASGFGVALAVCASCATYVDEPPPRSSSAAGSAGAEAGTSAVAGSSPTTSGGSPASAGAAGAAGQHSEGGQKADGGSAGGGAAGAGASGRGGGGSGGSGGSAGSAGSGGNGGVAGNGATAGSAGKASAGGGAGGGGGAPAVATCAKNPIPAKATWNVTASHSQANGVDPVGNTKDGLLTNRWTSAKDQAGDEWLQVDFGAAVTLTTVTLVLGSSPDDYPRKYAVRLSGSAQNSGAPVLASGMGAQATDTTVTLPAGSVGRYLLISQGGAVAGLWWSVAEIQAACAD